MSAAPSTRGALHHWPTILLLVGSVAAAVWVVKNLRPPGSMTVVEAQGMDMTTAKPPAGTQAVSVDEVTERAVGGTETYPATVAALTDEDVAARIPGKLARLTVYPGDRVKPGQLLGVLDAAEYGAQASESSLTASSKLAFATAALRAVADQQAAVARAQAAVKGARLAVERANADRDAMKAEYDHRQHDISIARADYLSQEALAKYSDQQLDRQKKLFSQGFVSLNDVQAAQRDRDEAYAKLASAEGQIQSAEGEVNVAQKQLDASQKGVDQAKAAVEVSGADLKQSLAALAKSQADALAAKLDAASARAAAGGMADLAGYRELRSLSGGVVAERVVAPGTSVMAGQVVLRVRQIDTVRVQADLPQSLLNKVTEGASIDVVTEGGTKSAMVTSVFPDVSADSRTFRVEALVRNLDHSLSPGMFARVRVRIGGGVKSLAVPNEAVQDDRQGGHYVWVVKESDNQSVVTDWTCTMHPQVSEKGPGQCPICKMDLVPRRKGGLASVEKRDVTVGASDLVYTIVESGLEEGEHVVVKGIEGLEPGTSVQETGVLPSRVDAPQPAGTGKPVAKDDYTCPMHEEISSDKPGKCPKCGMDLVRRSELR